MLIVEPVVSTAEPPQSLRPFADGGNSNSAGRGVLALVVILALGFAVRVEVLRRAENIARDGTVYLTMARQLGRAPAGNVLRSYPYHPGYPAAVSFLAGAIDADWPFGWIAVGRGVSVAMGLVALLALYFIAKAAFNRTIALITVALFGVSEALVRVSCDVISDSMAVAMAMLAVALGLGAAAALRRERFRAIPLAAAAGLAGGIGYLTRPEELLAAIIAAALLLVPLRMNRRARTIQLASLAALAAAVLICVVPYAMTIGCLTQKKTLSDFVLLGSQGPALATVSWSRQAVGAVRRTLDRGQAAVGIPITVLAIVAWTTWGGRYIFRVPLPRPVLITPTRRGAFAMFAASVVMVPLLVGLELNRGPGYLSSRHALMPAMLLAPAAGAGVLILAQWSLLLAGRLKMRRLPNLAVGLWLLAAMTGSAVKATPTLHRDKGSYRRAGVELTRRFGRGNYVLSCDSRTAFFAGAPAEQFQNHAEMPYQLKAEDLASVDALLARARAGAPTKHYRLIALSNSSLLKVGRPDLPAELTRDDSPLKFIAALPSSDAHEHKVWLFAWRDEAEAGR